MTDDQLDAEYAAAVAAAGPRCKCGHRRHTTNCPNVACGCTTYRPKETDQ